ncbi:MAG: DEAD/DEAH box helicase [Bryobacterales bacterium]|nr:DEAD/DEAH box helicase [Bryobacterales bacterium]
MSGGAFHPLVEAWFTSALGEATEPQRQAWPLIAEGRDVLISAPTGSGKTLAAFLTAIDALVREAENGPLPAETRVVYVSPLKALSNDIHRNLEVPLAGIADLARERGVELAPITRAVRTGDTPAAERRKMVTAPPHILVTTPESLYLLLTAEASRKALANVRTVIVDEIHAVARDKRGTHLALSIERLEHVAGRRLQRIGLSATVSPIEEVARYLAPGGGAAIVNTGHKRAMDLAIEIPRDELGPVASNELWGEIYDRLAALIDEHRTTLIFVNTRRLSERVAHALEERCGQDAVLAHHGSLALPIRQDAERRLKEGDLRAVVSTASLELGIDIGSVDLVCQIGSPRSIHVALQRVGRSGHSVGATPKGRFFPTTRDELLECGALLAGIRNGALEKLEIPQNALDILAQQVVAEVAAEPWDEQPLFELVRRSWPFRELANKDWDDVLTMLSDGVTTARGRAGAYLHRDQINGKLRPRRGARLAAITSGGAIPETGQYTVIAEPEGRKVGTLDEDFAIESMVGDIFLLGTHSWKIKRVEPGRVRVLDAQGAPPSVPFWFGEAPGRSAELSAEVAELREQLARDEDPGVFCESALAQAKAYIQTSAAMLGALPSSRTVVAERFFDEAGGMQLILHAPFGSRVNRAWGLALRKRFCRTFNFELQAAATDNGLVISLAEQHSFPLELVFAFLEPSQLEYTLTQAMLPAPMFGARWRWNATRALAVLRFRGGRKNPPPLQRMQSDDLLAAVFPDQVACAENLSGPIRIPDHPLVRETIDNCLREAMDVDRLHDILVDIENGAIQAVAVDTAEPSPLCHEILNANPYAFLDDAPLEERRTRAVALRRVLRTDPSDGVGVLDPEAIQTISSDSWPQVRDADELHDALLTLITLPPESEWAPWFDELVRQRRAFVHTRGGRPFWAAVERKALMEDARETLRGWMDSLGPVTAAGIAERLAFAPSDVEIALAALEGEGQILRGKFNPGAMETEWCNRRILARIHRATLGRLRREIEPVSSADLYRFFCRWQHVAPGSQLHGEDGLLQIIQQMQGYESPAAAWETEILPRRIRNYTPALLDRICLSGEVMWGRISPRAPSSSSRPARPTRVAPVSFFLREDADWLLGGAAAGAPLSPPAQDVLDALRTRGACFFADLTSASRRLPSEVEDALWELVAAGLVTADGFENLRSLLDPKRRRGEGRGRTARPRHAAGRWALLRRAEEERPLDAVRFARQLLDRWGVLFRDVLARETLAPPWRDLLPALRRMEAQGEIRGGRFADAFVGEQFAKPEALDLLRALRRTRDKDALADVDIPNADPLNLDGIVLPGVRVSPLTSGARSVAV